MKGLVYIRYSETALISLRAGGPLSGTGWSVIHGINRSLSIPGMIHRST